MAGLQVPVILFVDVAGSVGAGAFWHSGPICANVGVVGVVTTIFIVVGTPHCPAAGVKVYAVVPTVAVLIVAGLHVPVILLFDAVGKAGAVEFLHRGPNWVNVGVTLVVTTTSIFVEVPHCPAAGVNVYVAVPGVAVLIVAGLHVPVMPFEDVVGNAGAVVFWQNGPSCVNVGTAPLEITTVMVVLFPHCPASGVNV